jgi:hypothetical protein
MSVALACHCMEVNFSISKALNKKPSGAADYLTFAKIK